MEQGQLIRQKIMDSAEPGIIRMELYKVGWEQERLHCGDYKFFTYDYKKVGITRKKVEDLLASLSGFKAEDGKRRVPLPKQLEDMLDYYDILIFLLEGNWRKITPTSRIISSRGIEYHTWDMVWNFLRRWWDKGFTPELTIDEGHTIQRLNALYALYQKPYSLSGHSREFTDDRLLALPSGCRGKTGMAVLDGKSLKDISLMTVEELLEVEGIGDKKAQLIFNHFNRRNEKRHQEI